MKIFIFLFLLSQLVVPEITWAQFDAEETSTVDDETSSAKASTSETFTSKPAVTSDEIETLQKLVNTKDEVQVIKQVSQMLGKDDAHLDTLNLLAVYYYQNKKLGLAKLIINRALKSHPDSHQLYNNLGIIYLAENDLQKSIENFNKANTLKSNYDIAQTNLSSIYIKYKDYNRALGPLEDSYNQVKSDLRRGQANAIKVANNYAIALLGVGENSKASKVFEELVESGERNPVIYLNYSMLLVEVLKKKNDALRVLSKLKFMTEDNRILKKAEELERKLGQL